MAPTASTPKRRQRSVAHSPDTSAKSRKLSSTRGARSAAGIAAKNAYSGLLDRAARALQPAGHRGRLLPCREKERADVLGHLRAAMRRGGSQQILYVSGMPGTGKTALLMEAIDTLQGEKAVPAFTTVHVNAMRLGAPGAVFGCILSQLPGVEAKTARTAYPQPAVARGELERFFAERSATDPVIFVLVDEIDHLVTMNQAVLYRLFDWLAQPRARLVIAAISNTMDLPERLMPRVASRFDIVRVDFEPYNRFQLHQILCERLRGYDAEKAFDSLSLEFCAARVASGSGDIRKALQLCRRSVETRLASSGVEGVVDLQDIRGAMAELLDANPCVQKVTRLALRMRRFLTAALLELRRKDSEVVSLRRISSRYAKLMRVTSESDATSPDEQCHVAEYLSQQLAAMSLLIRQGKHIDHIVGPVFSLGQGLDIDDLSSGLLRAENDERIVELLR